MNSRNNILGVIFLVCVLVFALFAAKRLLFRDGSKGATAPALHLGASKPVAPALPKPSAAVQTPPSPAPSANTQAQQSTPTPNAAAGDSANAPSLAAKSAATATADRTVQLRLEAGARLWIRIASINRKPDESFTFHGILLQPVELANRNQLDQGTEVSGSGTVNNGHVIVLLTGFTVGGTNYALRENDASGSNKRPGAGLAVELTPGKLLEVWLASSSVYRKAR
jgi:hypothetical protein